MRIVHVPGLPEIPLVAKAPAASKAYSAVICPASSSAGTPHFDYLAAGGLRKGTAQAALETGIPVIFGVLTTDTLGAGGSDRAGGKAGNRGGMRRSLRSRWRTSRPLADQWDLAGRHASMRSRSCSRST